MTAPDIVFRDLAKETQIELARAEDLLPDEYAPFFDQLRPEYRWEILWTMNGRTGEHDADVARIAENADSETNAAFDRITRLDPASELFRRWTMPELLAEPDTFEWLIRGLLAQPTYGQIAGAMKTLKSYVLCFIMVGLASGEPIFDRFVPNGARPVLTYVGEGGRSLWTRRIRRVCAAMGVDPADIDLHPCFDVAPIGSLVFQESLRRDLDELEPALVGVDPWYTYHGAATRASDLHQEGALLNQLSMPCVETGAGVLVVNHFNQSGTGLSLKRITMAGSGEWADTWVLLEHRDEPDVENGLFRLTLEIGSRQWGGTTWDLDLDIGRFDMDTGSHDGQITWDLNRATTTSTSKVSAKDRQRFAILEALADMPWQLTKTELRKVVGGNYTAFGAALGELVEEDRICHNKRSRDESVTKSRPVWGLRSTPPDVDGTAW